VRIHAATSSAARSRLRRGAALAVPLIAVGSALAIYGGTAGAAPQPTISQVQAQVNSLQAKVDRIGQQYDAASEQLTAAKSRLAQVNREATLAQQRFETARRQLTQVAVAAYMDSNQSSVLGLLTSGNPSDVLNQASLVTQVAGMHQAQAAQFLGDAQQLTSVVQQRQRTESGIAAVQKQLAAQKNSMGKLLASKKSTLESLTAAQQAQVAANTIGGGGTTSSGSGSGTTQPTYTGPTSSQAGKAVAFAYAQLGKPYQWGATGPGSYDCSGLVQAAWASAGVSIPRTTYDMWASLPHISSSSIQPGDLLFYAGESHVSIYVGGGYIIDAPQTGENVQKISESGWYASNFDGAVRP
jgi:cell wall-associated NlpC family hydrolase